MIKQLGLKKQTAPIAIGVKIKQNRKDKRILFYLLAVILKTKLPRSKSIKKNLQKVVQIVNFAK